MNWLWLESLGYDNRKQSGSGFAEMADYLESSVVLQGCGGTLRRTEAASEPAAIMAMHPSLLILDEPTSQLDPIAASDFLETVKKSIVTSERQ